MANELHIITVRRREVEQEIARAREVIVSGEKELVELDMAASVLARLTGASWPPVGEADQQSKAGDASISARVDLTVPQMITQVLRDAHKRGVTMMEPKDIRQAIEAELDPSIRSEAVSSIVWRMWKRNQLQKVEGTSAYRLVQLLPGMKGFVTDAQNEKPVDAKSSPDTSTGLFNNPELGREAGQGGGT